VDLQIYEVEAAIYDLEMLHCNNILEEYAAIVKVIV
jgi:hypothetical protein